MFACVSDGSSAPQAADLVVGPFLMVNCRDGQAAPRLAMD